MSALKAVYAFFRRIGSIGAMMKDPSVKLWKKLLVIGGIIYLFLPVDLIPPFILPIGWVDDLLLWVFITWLLRDTLDRYWKKNVPKSYSKKYPDAVDVDFKVKEDEEEKKK